jgi:long-chain acyl-CoA synthetase
LTESSPVISVSNFENYRPGTVGRPIADVEVRIDDSGEILARGPNIMQGYWQNEAATAEAIVDGWLYTGDLGEFDEAGNLKIVGRKKEIIVLMTGKNVSPTNVEQRLTASALIENACVVGDDRKCLAALIVPNEGMLDGVLQDHQIQLEPSADIARHPQVADIYRQEINRVLSDVSHEEQVGLFLLVERPFSLENGELTAKLSLRRKMVEANFADQIEQMYGG